MVSRAALAELKSAYRSWNTTKAESADKFIALLADDFKMGSLAAGAAGMEFSREHVSPAEARNYFAEMLKDWTMLFFHVRDYIVQGNNVAVVCECGWRHITTGQIVHSPKLDLWTFKNGKAIAFFEFYDTDQAIGACADCGPVLRKDPKPLYPESGAKTHAAISASARANLRNLKAFYKRYGLAKGANFKEGIDMLAPSITWMSLANGANGMPFTVKRTTSKEVEGYFTGLYADWEMLEYNIEKYIAAGPYVLASGSVRFRNRRTGKELSTPKADCYRYSHGKIVEFMEYYDTAGAVRAAS
jgi:uncharacterized protein